MGRRWDAERIAGWQWDHPAEAAAILRRQREADLAAMERRLPAEHTGAADAVVQTIAIGAYPTAAVAVYAVQAVTVSGVESEGAAPSLSGAGGIFYVANVGKAVPPLGAKLLATLVGGRFICQFDG